MSKFDTLKQIMDEVEVGLEKLDTREYWTCNSHSTSLLLVSSFLFLLGWMGVFIGWYYTLKVKWYYTLKVKVYWRLKFRRLL